MVLRKNLKKKFALISVYDKTNLKYLCSNLHRYNYSLISSGSTGKKIRSMGFKCTDISKITKFKEMFNGRVKTLNPLIYSSLLYVRDNDTHKKEFLNLKVPEIDIVIVNLYPFKKYKKYKDDTNIIEMIDIGGPSLLRAASKNFKYLTAIIDLKDYKNLILNLKKNDGETDIEFRKKMASKTFKETSRYDKVISNWFNEKKSNKTKLRYGENPNQKAYLIHNRKNSIFNYQLNGKKISYNNLIDIDSGLRCLNEFREPTSIIVKHTNPCGVCSAKNINIAFKKSYECDSKSAFGGIVLLNRKVDTKLATRIFKNFFEMIVAPDFSDGALKILRLKKNLILLKLPKIKNSDIDHKSTLFGDLYQTNGFDKINKNFIKLASDKKISSKSKEDLIFSLKVVKHLKSNAVVLSNNKQTIGLGLGQTNRIDALKFALENKKKYYAKSSFVCASDGFFPFVDSITLLNKNGCNVIAQPSGSINDSKIISFAIKNKIALYFIKHRLFKH